MMIKKLLTPLLLAAACAGTQAATLEVQVSGLASTEGRVLLAVYDSAEGWMKKAVRFAAGKPEEGGRLLLRIENLPDGDYAFSLLHDANGNNKMDSNALGIPTESFGFSNNATGTFGPPKFESARFTLKGDTVQQIKLN